MELKRTKPYKSRKPEDTIFFIREILHRNLGVLLKEEHYVGDGRFYSCRINIGNYNLNELNIGTNGKGMTMEYALASAYGEFMERLENQILIMRQSSGKHNNRDVKYRYAPDEINIKFHKSMEYIRKNIKSPNVEQLECIYNDKDITLVPYVNVMDEMVELLPLNIILSMCTSNGMCAGNTPKEAIIQGMSEILERFVVRKIYFDNVSFPTIPLDVFTNTKIYEQIIGLRAKYEWEFFIKDCSCNIGIPAIGVLIIDRKNMKYMYHLGVDPSPITALERTLTEIYQGRFSLSLKPIDVELQNRLLHDINLKSKEMFRTCTTGEGQFPISLLWGEPTYSFEGFDLTWGQSDENDYKKMIQLFSNLNVKVFIRDVSFLGFPAYHIYVPGMSEFRNISSNHDLESANLLKNVYPIGRNLEKADNDDIRILLEYIDKNDESAFINLSFYNTSDLWQCYDKDLILALLYYTISEYEKSLKHIKVFIENTEQSDKEHKFFTCLYTIIKSRIYDYDKKWINESFGVEYVNTCNEFLANKNYLKYLNHSNCHFCESCRIKSSCRVEDILALEEKIENAYIENTPNQNELLSLLCE